MPGKVISNTSAVLVIIQAVSAALMVSCLAMKGLVARRCGRRGFSRRYRGSRCGCHGSRSGVRGGKGGRGAASVTVPEAAVRAWALNDQLKATMPANSARKGIPFWCIVILCVFQHRAQSTSYANPSSLVTKATPGRQG